MSYFKRAWRDTWNSLGGWTVIYFVIAIPFIGFGLHYLISGTEPMSAEFQIWLIYGLAATGLASLSLFVWNLACAPFRIERDRRISAEDEVASISAKAKPAPRFEVEIEAVTSGETEYGGMVDICLAWVRVKNVGDMPSISDHWNLTIKDGATAVKTRLTHIENITTGTGAGGPGMKLTADKALYNMAETVIPVGGILRGHLVATAKLGEITNLDLGAVVTASCVDVLGNSYEGHYDLAGIKDSPLYIPGATILYSK